MDEYMVYRNEAINRYKSQREDRIRLRNGIESDDETEYETREEIVEIFVGENRRIVV